MKLGGNRPPGDNPLLFSTSGTGSTDSPQVTVYSSQGRTWEFFGGGGDFTYWQAKNAETHACIEESELDINTGVIDLKTSEIIENMKNHRNLEYSLKTEEIIWNNWELLKTQ